MRGRKKHTDTGGDSQSDQGEVRRRVGHRVEREKSRNRGKADLSLCRNGDAPATIEGRGIERKRLFLKRGQKGKRGGGLGGGERG